MEALSLRTKKYTLACLCSVFCLVASGAELAGTWTLSIDTPRGVQHPSLVIELQDEAYSGVYHSRRGPISIPAIARNGAAFSFPLTITVPIGEIEVLYSGKVDGDQMRGSAKNPRGEVPFTGVRSKD